MQRAPRSPSRGCGRPGLPGSARRGSQGAPRASRGRAVGCRPSPALSRGGGFRAALPAGRGRREAASEAPGIQLPASSRQLAPRRVRYLPSRPLRMPGGAAAGNPGPSPAGGPQAEPEARRPRGEGAASRGAAALPAGGFSVSFRALAGTGLPGARRGRGRECARVGRCGRAWVWVCMCVRVFMGEVGVCVRVCVLFPLRYLLCLYNYLVVCLFACYLSPPGDSRLHEGGKFTALPSAPIAVSGT